MKNKSYILILFFFFGSMFWIFDWALDYILFDNNLFGCEFGLKLLSIKGFLHLIFLALFITMNIFVLKSTRKRKWAEQALRISEQKYRTIFQNIQDVYYEVRIDGIIIELNEAVKHLTKYTREELIGTSIYKVYAYPESRGEFLKALAMYGKVIDYEFVLKDKDGRFVPFSANAMIITDEDDKPVKVVGTLRDITRRKQTENRLEKLNDCLVNLGHDPLENIIKMVSLCGEEMGAKLALYNRLEDGKLCTIGLWGNEFCGDSHGRPKGRICSDLLKETNDQLKIVRDLPNSKYAAEDPAILAFNVTTYVGKVVKLFNEKIGTICVWYEKDTVPSKEDEWFLSLVASAIASEEERLHSAAMLKESEEKFRVIFEKAFIGITNVSADGRFIKANKMFCDIVGYSQDEILKMNFRDLTHPDDLPESIELGRQVEADNMNSFTLEKRYIRKDKSIIWVKLRATVLKNPSNEFKYYISVIEDITVRKQIEEQIASALKEKNVLLKEIHHRVKNNMQVISSLLNLQSGFIQDELAKNVFKASQNRIRTMALVHETLYNADNLGEINVQEYITALTAFLHQSYLPEQSVVQIKTRVENVSLGIDTVIPCGLIITELVTNSLKYAFPNQNHGIIRVDFKCKEGRYILKISDDGIGIPVKIDFRETVTLGLQLVTNLTEQINGHIELDTSNGTAFKIVFLPFHKEK